MLYNSHPWKCRMRLMDSNSTAFLALECWTFLDLLGSWVLFNTVSSASLRRARTTGSSEAKKYLLSHLYIHAHTKIKTAGKFSGLAVYIHIPTNLSRTKSGTKSLKKRDFWSKIEIFSRILWKQSKIIKLSGKLIHKNTVKKWDKVKKKQDNSKLWTKNRDCPS